MRILVLSDSHGMKKGMEEAVLKFNPNIFIHLGDYSSDCVYLQSVFPGIEVRSVRGNCDMTGDAPVTDEFVMGGKRFFMSHGHIYKVKLGLDEIIDNALVRKADVLLFGHTHVPMLQVVNRMLVINPGSAAYSRGTCAVLDMEKGEVHGRIMSIENI